MFLFSICNNWLWRTLPSAVITGALLSIWYTLDSFHIHFKVSVTCPIPPVRQEQEMQTALQEDDKESSEGSFYQDTTRTDFSQQSFLAPLVQQELEASTGSSVDQNSTQQVSLRSLENNNDQTSILQEPTLVSSSTSCDTSTNGTSKAHNSHLPKQVFPWMKETRHSTKQNSSLPSSGTSFHLLSPLFSLNI